MDTDKYESTSIPRLDVSGDASRDLQVAIVPSAEGAKAAAMLKEDLQ